MPPSLPGPVSGPPTGSIFGGPTQAELHLTAAAGHDISDNVSARRALWLLDRCRRVAGYRSQLQATLNDLRQDEAAAKRELADLLGVRRPIDESTEPNEGPVALDSPTHPHGDRPNLSIWLLGEFRIAAKAVLVVGGKDDRSSPLLRFLAASSPPGVHKERLAALFWPEADPQAARRNLHQGIYSIRRLLGRHGAEGELTFVNDHYRLGRAPGPWRDVDELTRWIDAARNAKRMGDDDAAITAYRRADLSYGGAFLADHPYDEWAAARREHYRALHREATSPLLAHSWATNDYCSLLQLASRRLGLDPCDEEACRYLMRAYDVLGEPHLVVMAFRSLETGLRQQFDLEPSFETATLARSLTNGHQQR